LTSAAVGHLEITVELAVEKAVKRIAIKALAPAGVYAFGGIPPYIVLTLAYTSQIRERSSQVQPHQDYTLRYLIFFCLQFSTLITVYFTCPLSYSTQ
jgi:hypothetical protein